MSNASAIAAPESCVHELLARLRSFSLLSRWAGMVSKWLAVVLALMVFGGATSRSQGEQRFLREPENTTALLGSRLILPCRVTDVSGKVQWTKDDFGLGDKRNMPAYDRYRMIGREEEGDFSLEINPVTLEDEDRYQCQVGFGPRGQQGIRSRYATVSVLVPPGPPKITQGDHLATFEGREVALECLSTGGRPPAEVSWRNGEGQVVNQKVNHSSNSLFDGNVSATRSVLKLIAGKRDNNSTFTCQARHPAEPALSTAKLTLHVYYGPQVNLEVTSGVGVTGKIQEGANASLTCKADGNPPQMTYEWYVNGEPVPGVSGTELVIPGVTRKANGVVVMCRARNFVGESGASKTLDVQYAPTFRSRPKSLKSEIGVNVTLFCDVDGNPPPEVLWLHKNTGRVVGRSANLTVTVDRDSDDAYCCKAFAPEFDNVEMECAVDVGELPTIKSARGLSRAGGKGSRLECVAVSNSGPARLSWTFQGEHIDSANESYSIIEERLGNETKSILAIHDDGPDRLGTYTCAAYNSYGTSFAKIILEAENSIWPLAGGLALLALALGVAFLLITRKTKSKAGKDRADGDAFSLGRAQETPANSLLGAFSPQPRVTSTRSTPLESASYLRPTVGQPEREFSPPRTGRLYRHYAGFLDSISLSERERHIFSDHPVAWNPARANCARNPEGNLRPWASFLADPRGNSPRPGCLFRSTLPVACRPPHSLDVFIPEDTPAQRK